MAKRAIKVPKGRTARMLGLAALTAVAVIAGIFLWRSFSFSEHFDASAKVSFAPASGTASDAMEGGMVRSKRNLYSGGVYRGSATTETNDKKERYKGEWIQFEGKGDTVTLTNKDTDLPRSVAIMGSVTGKESSFFVIGGSAALPATPNAANTLTLKEWRKWPFVRVIIRSTWPAQGAIKNESTALFNDIKQTTTGAPVPAPQAPAGGASTSTPQPAPVTADTKLRNICTEFCTPTAANAGVKPMCDKYCPV